MLNKEVMFAKVYNSWNIAYLLRARVVGFSKSGYFVHDQRKEFPYYVCMHKIASMYSERMKN